jgi:hypothetical protein
MKSMKTPPPTVRKRNELGLYDDVEYKYLENGDVDWRHMVPSRYIVPNKQRTQETDTAKLSDKELLILLNGFKNVAKLRGTLSVKGSVVPVSHDMICANCEIKWKGNYETDGDEETSYGAADAHFLTATGFGKNYLTTVAENRAFVRAVRNFLGIEILGFDEIDLKVQEDGTRPMTDDITSPASEEQDADYDPVKSLDRIMNKKGVKWTHILERLKEEGFEGIENITEPKDLPGIKIMEMIKRISSIKK